jgi:signal transduction histidine kinase
MRRVEQESARMGVLVEDMLLLARLDQQRPLDLRTVDLLTMAADAVHDARVVAPDRSINLEVGSRAALLVTGDEVRLRQVISNLMSNALVHTPPGTPIEVRLRTGSLAEAQAAAASRAGGEAQAATAIDWSAAGEAASRPAASGALAPDGTIMGNEHSAAEGAAAAGPAAGESQQAWTATPMRDTTKRGEASVARATSAAHGATAAGGTGPALGRADGGWPDPAMTPAAPEAGAARSPSGVGRAGTAWPAAVLEVADLGSGLSPEQSEHVFERFYRADQARTSGGSGLGLAIVSALVTAHGGAVWVDSRPGEGATFSIALPLAPEVVGHEAEHDELDPPADEQFGHGAATSTDEAAGQPAGPADHQSDAAGGWPPPEGQDRRQLPKLDFTQPEVIELRRSQEPPG